MPPRNPSLSDLDDDQEDFDLASDIESAEGGVDELLVGRSGRPGADTFDPVESLDDVGEYEGSEESLPPDYSYRVSTSVSDRYGEYPYPGAEDLPLGYATDDGVGLVYHGTDLVEAVTEVAGKGAYAVELTDTGVTETRIEPRLLTAP